MPNFEVTRYRRRFKWQRSNCFKSGILKNIHHFGAGVRKKMAVGVGCELPMFMRRSISDLGKLRKLIFKIVPIWCGNNQKAARI